MNILKVKSLLRYIGIVSERQQTYVFGTEKELVCSREKSQKKGGEHIFDQINKHKFVPGYHNSKRERNPFLGLEANTSILEKYAESLHKPEQKQQIITKARV